jgi:hypothetical protein
MRDAPTHQTEGSAPNPRRQCSLVPHLAVRRYPNRDANAGSLERSWANPGAGSVRLPMQLPTPMQRGMPTVSRRAAQAQRTQ